MKNINTTTQRFLAVVGVEPCGTYRDGAALYSKQYEVEKYARGMSGEWFGFGARRFRELSAARTYFEAFAADQVGVLSNGIRIDLRERKGRRLLATVGGCLGDATVIREVAS